MVKNFPLLLHETATAWRNLLDKRLKPLGLSQAKWRTLFYLSITEEPLTQTQLAQLMGIEGATIVGLIDRLANEGWVIRQWDENDRRIRIIHLTEKAKSTLNHIQNTSNQLCNELLSPLSDVALETCMQTLQKIKKYAEDTHE